MKNKKTLIDHRILNEIALIFWMRTYGSLLTRSKINWNSVEKNLIKALILNAEHKELVNHFKETNLINGESFAVYEKTIDGNGVQYYLIRTRGVNNIKLPVLHFQMFFMHNRACGRRKMPKVHMKCGIG
ncbi:hypothetical protein PAV_7c00270 [Paenibacillus alvei DSM 29]|nr:hypothetical protein PAV_7c00270 [Paenibacillus alvei DSM 29]